MQNIEIITNNTLRHDFVLLFDVLDGNPNGDPDAGNLPRIDPETMQGLVTDVCIKRKIRNYVDALCKDKEGLRIYIQSVTALNDLHQKAYEAEGIKSTGTKQKREDVTKAKSWMCKNYFDVRMFGAVMTTEVNCGQVRGPIQMTFARSLDTIVPLDVCITRIAITKPKDMEFVAGETEDDRGKGGKVTEMGRKSLVPYGLYRGSGFYSALLGDKEKGTGVSRDDLEIFWKALLNGWEIDRSASRGMMACRGLYIFSHDSKYGNAHAYKLFERITAKLKDGVTVPRNFTDYEISVNSEGLPAGITLNCFV